jgi:DHA2 family multidrug resistance protein
MTRAVGLSSEAYESKFELRIVMLCSMAGTLMQALDSTIANVALPYMQGSLSAIARPDHLGADILHHRRGDHDRAGGLACIPVRPQERGPCQPAGFTITSMMCGAAQTLDQMVVFRLLQGVFGAALVPLSQATCWTSIREKRGQAMAIWGMGVMVGRSWARRWAAI